MKLPFPQPQLEWAVTHLMYKRISLLESFITISLHLNDGIPAYTNPEDHIPFFTTFLHFHA